VEIRARYVHEEEKIWIELIYSAHLLERISQVANTAPYRVLKTLSHTDGKLG
jgi:hypothetical protein